MYLIKCSCDCFFTLTQKLVSLDGIRCPNCGNRVASIHENKEVCDITRSFKESGMTLQIIPDSSKISVTFDV